MPKYLSFQRTSFHLVRKASCPDEGGGHNRLESILLCAKPSFYRKVGKDLSKALPLYSLLNTNSTHVENVRHINVTLCYTLTSHCLAAVMVVGLHIGRWDLCWLDWALFQDGLRSRAGPLYSATPSSTSTNHEICLSTWWMKLGLIKPVYLTNRLWPGDWHQATFVSNTNGKHNKGSTTRLYLSPGLADMNI